MEIDRPSGRRFGAAEMHHQHVHVSRELDEGGVRTVLIAAERQADVSHVHPVPHGRHVGMRHPDAADPDVAVAPDLGGRAGRDVHGDRLQLEAAGEHPEDPARSEQPVQPVVQRRERNAPGRAGDPQPGAAGPQQRRHLGGVVGMKVAEGQQPHVSEIGARRVEALLDAAAGVDQDAAGAVDPDEVAGRGPPGGCARSPRAQDLELHAGLSARRQRRLDRQEKTEGREDHRAEQACHHRKPRRSVAQLDATAIAVGHRRFLDADGNRLAVRQARETVEDGLRPGAVGNFMSIAVLKDTDGNYLAVCHARQPACNGLCLGAVGNFISDHCPYGTVNATSRWAGSTPSRSRQVAMMSSNRAAGMGMPGTTSRMRRASSSKSQMNSRPVPCFV